MAAFFLFRAMRKLTCFLETDFRVWSVRINRDNMIKSEVRNSLVTKSSYETELRKMTSHFGLLTRRFLWKFFFRVTNLTS